MKLINKVFILAAAIFGAVGCIEEDSPVSSAILADVNSLTFEAKDAAAQSFNVISEGVWTVETPEWVTTDITTGGAGQTAVSVTVADNFIGEQMQLPRTDTLFLKGADRYADFMVIIKQLGDTYLGAKEGSVSDAIALELGTGFGLTESQVVAVSTAGFVVTDGKSNIYVDAVAEVAVGDKVTLKGLRSDVNGLPALSSCENIAVSGNAAAQHTSVKDLSSSLAGYTSTSIDHVVVKGATLVGSQIISTDGGKLVFHAAPESFNIAGLNAHFVDVEGYYLSVDKGGNGPFVVLTSVEDKGLNENVKLPVKWNAIANDYPKWTGVNVTSGKAGVIEPVEGFGQISYNFGMEQRIKDGVEADPESKLDINGDNPRVNGVWVGDYWEFLSYVPAKAGQVIKLEFEMRISAAGLRYWKMQYKDGDEWKDCRKLKSVEKGGAIIEYTDDVAPGGGEEANKVITHVVKYANDTDAIIFRWISMSPWRGNNDTEPLGNPSTASMRLDRSDALAVQPSISVATEAELPNDNVANVEVTVDKSLTFEALPGQPKSFKVLSDNEVELTTDSDWIFFVGADEALVESMVIPAGAETEVFVNCAENVEPSTREGLITVKSGATVETIKVTQVSPGVSLEPFVSIVGGNSGNVSFAEGSFNLAVQTNVDFEFSSDAAWVNVQAVPETRALVEVKPLVVTYEANADSQERTAHIRVFNADNNIETVYTLTQAGFESGVYFQEDFTWVAPWADAYGSADSVGENDEAGKAPNVYTQKSHLAYDGVGYVNGGAGVEGHPSFLEAFAQRGYEDLNPAGQVIYTQKYYLKFGKTSYHTGIKLPANEFEGNYPTNVDLTFDWAAHMLGDDKGNVLDDVQIVVELEGPGVCAGSGEKVSTAFVTTQVDGQLAWQKASVVLMGVTKDTRISIRPLKMSEATPKTQRWYIDNIKLANSDVPVKFFEETWDWVSPWADVYGSADSVGENDHSGKAPNVYTQKSHLAYDGVGYADGGAGVEGYPSFLEAFAERGYTDLNPAGQVMYTQKYYMKFGKTNVHTGITLPSNEFMGDKPVDVEVSFNWCAHMISKEPYTFDKVQMVIEITGPGTCADSNSKVSNAYDTHQQNGLMEWQDFSVRVNGVTKDTKITIRPLNWDKIDKDGADYKVQRYHLDNILIQSAR